MGTTGYLTAVLNVLATAILELCSLLGALVIAGFLLGFLEARTNRRMIRAYGLKGVYWTAWFGTPIHELGHALMCLIFHHRIQAIRLFQTADDHGTLGYVSHRFNPDSFYQQAGNLFIGMGPLISGGAVILTMAYFLLPPDAHFFFSSLVSFENNFSLLEPLTWRDWLQTFLQMLRGLFAGGNFMDPFYWLFLYLAVCVSAHMSLSRTDIRGALSGLGVLFLFCVLASGIGFFLDSGITGQIMGWIGRFNYEFMLLLATAVLFSAVNWALTWAIAGIRNKLSH